QADSARVGRLRALNGVTVYPTSAPVRGTAARVVQWRKVAGSARGRQELSRLIGSDAMLLIGNADSSHWSDLVRATTGPSPSARVEAIPGSPWLVAVDFSREVILAPVKRFLWRLGYITLAAVVIALTVTWLATRRFTKPLRDLTRAASSVASGHYIPPPRIDRADEVGQLGDAFATMAAEVRDARIGLEAKVEERTSDLNRTLDELHDAQATLVRREKLATLGQLAGGVGHELRNPLGVMTNAVYYLRMVAPTEPATVHEYLDILQQQITLSEKIVTDLLDFARSKRPTRTPMSLVEVTGLQLARLGPTNGVRVDADLRTIVPHVFADQVQVGQIILNLLTNAVQAVDGSGVVTVRIGADGDNVHVDVSDSGPGIAAAHVEKIFEPLFTTKARGIGLGLSVSRTLARANDGDLMLVSLPGQGATFRLVLPMSNGAVA
ncbi:MAG TPA: ATP-binding protein, partial [Gemmatimonadaceae bacterium]